MQPPISNNRNGKRPHAHFDIEQLFIDEKLGLKTLEGNDFIPGLKKRENTVLWSYPPVWDYEQTKSQQKKSRDKAGPYRIITDRDQNIIRVVVHPKEDKKNFVRAHRRAPGNLHSTYSVFSLCVVCISLYWNLDVIFWLVQRLL
jgi:hypothetical protein